MKNYQQANLSAAYAVTNVWANIPGLILTCSKTGYYTIISDYEIDVATAPRGATSRFAINGVAVGGMSATIFQPTATANVLVTRIRKHIYIKKGDIVSAQAIYSSNTVNVNFSGTTHDGSLSISEE